MDETKLVNHSQNVLIESNEIVEKKHRPKVGADEELDVAEFSDKESIEELSLKQRVEDKLKIEQIKSLLMEVPEELELSMEQVLQYKEAYLSEFGREKPVPTEYERLQSLQKFVYNDKIDGLKGGLSTIINKPKDFKKKFRNMIFPAQKKHTLKIINEELEAEHNDFFDVDFENENPIIVGENIFERMHGVDRGNYIHSFDQFGCEYFIGPDTEYDLDKYVNVLAQYFNVNKIATVRYPVALEGSRHTYKSKLKSAFLEQKMTRQLAETSHLVDTSKISVKDCDEIDPMPIIDSDRSFLSGVAINLLTGAYDRVVDNSATSGNRHNYYVRKDGVYYLYDLEGIYLKNDFNVGRQMEQLGNFFKNQKSETKKTFIEYFVKTSIFLSCLPVTDNIKYGIENHYAQFPKRLHDSVINSKFMDDQTKQEFLEIFKTELEKVISEK